MIRFVNIFEGVKIKDYFIEMNEFYVMIRFKWAENNRPSFRRCLLLFERNELSTEWVYPFFGVYRI